MKVEQLKYFTEASQLRDRSVIWYLWFIIFLKTCFYNNIFQTIWEHTRS